jgi:predicted 3-demethylubiquinone-9 3-methyltransferase (glyoxalase superfamily)
MQKITTFLWLNNNAEEAINFYCSIFPDAQLLSATRCGEAGPGPAGSLLTASFQLAGQEFAALNGGPMFKFNEAVSLVVNCESQDEVDHYWGKLSAGGQEQPCGWLKDKFGLSWQIVPTALPKLLSHPDPAKAARVMQAMLQMKKIDIAALEAA